MQYVLNAAQMKAADSYTSKEIGIDSAVLMERAAAAVAAALEQDIPAAEKPSSVWRAAAQTAQTESGKNSGTFGNSAKSQDFPTWGDGVRGSFRVAVLAGSGNNGADGIAAGRILLCRGYDVRVFLTGRTPAPDSLCAKQISILEHCGGKTESFSTAALFAFHPQAIIDAITGIGLHADKEQGAHPSSQDQKNSTGSAFPAQAVWAAESLHRMERTRIYAVDMPSGVLADSGKTMGTAVRADVTITFGFAKRGQLLYPGAEHCGDLRVEDIGINHCSLEGILSKEEPESRTLCGSPLLFSYDRERAADLLPSRLPSGNKGTFGKVLIIAGSRNMCGAALLSARACSRSGAGMVKVFTEECNRVILQSSAPELLLGTYEPEELLDPARRKTTFDQLAESLAWADTVVIGPGLGRGQAAQYLVTFALAWLSENLENQQEARRFKGIVIDADAVRIIGEMGELSSLISTIGEKTPVVFTPHMAECAALLGTPVASLQENVPDKIRAYADAHHCCILCKDARSICADWKHREIYLNVSGNDGLSTAGSGDVLSGMTGAFLGQGMDGFAAACAASWLHGKAAELLTGSAKAADTQAGAGQNTRSLMAGDLVEALDRVLRNPL